MRKPPPLTLEEARRCIEAVEQKLREGYPPRTMIGSHDLSAVRAAANDLGMHATSFLNRVSPGGSIERRFGLRIDWGQYTPRQSTALPAIEDDRPFVQGTPPEPEPGQNYDASFWRRRAAELTRDLQKTEHILGQISGLVQPEVIPPEWLMPEPGTKRRAVVGALLTDIHFGEVVSADEVLGLNAYDPSIAEARVRRFFEAVCAIGPRWGSDSEIVGAVCAIGGDLISGDIHEELRITNAVTSTEQVRGVAAILASGLRLLADAFGRVYVPCVPGNHGRTTIKPTAKLYARLSYDTLACQMAADALAGDDRITFQIAAGRDLTFPVLGRTIFLNHGDGMGTGGGQGFIGPLAPIVRGTKKVEAQQARAGRRPDLILHGHYHTSANPGPVLSNGSVPGYTEYGNGLRSGIEPPQQWAFLLHEKWGLRERAEIKLEDPGIPEKPVVRVPAVMSAR